MVFGKFNLSLYICNKFNEKYIMWGNRYFRYTVSVTEFLNLNNSLITNVQITYDTSRNLYVVFFSTLKDDGFIYEYDEIPDLV